MSNPIGQAGIREITLFSIVHLLLIYGFIIVIEQIVEPDTALGAGRLTAIVGGVLCAINLVTLTLSRMARV